MDMDLPVLLDRALRSTSNAVAAVAPAAWDGPSPCQRWSVRQVGNHLVGMIGLTTQIVTGAELDAGDTQPDKLDQDKLANTDLLGPNPLASLRVAGERCVAAFAEPGVLERGFQARTPDTPGWVLASLSLMELLTHGWDIATGGKVDYTPDEEVVAAVREFAGGFVGDEARALGLFGPPVPVGPGADLLTAHLGHLGRRSPWPGAAAQEQPAA
jgi:uncharacterized protein (TIGR03086 family)